MLFHEVVFGNGKSKYSFASNMIYALKEMWKWNKLYFLLTVAGFIPAVAGSYVGTLLPARVVADLEQGSSLQLLLLHLGGLSLLAWVCNLSCGMMEQYKDVRIWDYMLHFRKKYIHKIMDMDYDKLESQDYQHVLGNVAASVTRGRGLTGLPYLSLGLKNIALAVLYSALLCRVSPLLALAVLVTVFINLRLLALARKKHSEHYGEMSLHSRRMAYINTQSQSSAAGKDIRIYNLMGWFLDKYDQSLQEVGRTFGKIHNWYMIRNLSDAVLVLARNWIIYAYLLYGLVQGQISASEFVFYIGLVNGLAENFEYILRVLMSCNNISMTFSYIREFLSWEDDWKRGEGIGENELEKLLASPVKLELKDVSFTYPGSEKPVLSHISLTVRPGEKLALLGLNGAGKTTLVKLICGFYHPMEGEILVNDIPIERFSRDEYEKVVSVLFQECTILPLTLDENITSHPGTVLERKKLDKALAASGFWERYNRLSEKGRTNLVKEVNEQAVDFSGGEKQKLLFARALYKEAPLLILDEPTAALDPIAENELYMNYGRATEYATSIYISHRLSSTRFCDRIVLLEDGKLVEEGTHEELMRGDTRYAGLYEMQSKYYKEEQEKEKQREAFGEQTGGVQE